MYKSDFEECFLRQTNEYYQRQAVSQLNQTAVPEYLSYVTRSLEDEERRLRLYLGSSSREQVGDSRLYPNISNHTSISRQFILASLDYMLRVNVIRKLRLGVMKGKVAENRTKCTGPKQCSLFIVDRCRQYVTSISLLIYFTSPPSLYIHFFLSLSLSLFLSLSLSPLSLSLPLITWPVEV
eukprot:sb/3471650/